MSVRALIVGSGFGGRVVAGCYKEAGMEVEVVSARDRNVVAAACARDFDLVSIHAPPFLHSEYVNLALDHERNVLCDKPFGMSAGEAQQMLDRARDTKVIHLLNFEFRYDPGRRRVKEIIDAGTIGKITHVHWNFFNGFSRIPLRRHDWQFDEANGGGWIRINSTHMIDALRWLVGDIGEVQAWGRTDVPERPDRDGNRVPSTAEDGFAAHLTLASGATAIFDTAWATPGTLPDRWTVIGTEGMLDITERIQLWVDPMVRDTEIRLLAGQSESVERIGPFEGDAHLPAMRPFAHAVREAIEDRRQISPSFADGLEAAKVVDRLRASIARDR